MELTFLASLLSLTLLLNSIWHLIIKGRNFGGQKLPPGPWKLPLIGSIHHLAGSSPPHHVLTNLARKYGPVMHLQLGEHLTVVVSSSEAAKDVLKIHDVKLASRPEILASKILAYNNINIAFSPYGDYWKQMRKICILELLSPRMVRSFTTIREDEAWKMIQSINSCTDSTLNLTQLIFSFTNDVVCKAAFGNKCKDQDRLISLIHEAILVAGGFEIADLFPSKKYLHVFSGLKGKLLKLHKQMDQVLDSIINEHKNGEKQKGESENEDLVDVLLRLKGSDELPIPLSTNSIKAVIWDIFAAGTETSAGTIDWAMAEMIRNPQVMEKAQTELRQALKGKKTIQEADLKSLNYLNFVIKETMRLHPPLPLLLPRECRQQCNVGGYEIPVKARVIVNAWAIHKDPEIWEDAERFWPERFGSVTTEMNLNYIPFGGGRRICPGVSFGMASIELALANLLYQFDWKLPNPSGMKGEMVVDMTEIFGATAKRKTSLNLVASLYSPLG